MTTFPTAFRIPTSRARERLADIMRHVQDPRAYCVLTRLGKPVAAIVSMAELHRIWEDQDAEGWTDPAQRPAAAFTGPDGKPFATSREAAEYIRKVQLTRWQERDLLARAGMTPIEGGELAVEMTEPAATTGTAPGRGWWRRWWPGRAG